MKLKQKFFALFKKSNQNELNNTSTFSTHEFPNAQSDPLSIGMWSLYNSIVTLNPASQKLMDVMQATFALTEFIDLFTTPTIVAAAINGALIDKKGGLNCTVTRQKKTLRLFGKIYAGESVNGCIVDITDTVLHHEQQQQIQLLKILHEQDYQRKKKLLGLFRTVCHEIRNPLQGIISNLELIDTNTACSQLQIKKSVKDGLNACFYQLEILNDMINCQNLESLENRTTLLEIKDIHELLESVVSLFAETCRRKQLTLVIDDASESVKAKFSSKNVQQIIVNFVNNAVKFSRTGTITIRCSYMDNDFVLISVMDEGPGVNSDTRNRLFSGGIFKDRQLSNDHFSSGLGLDICADIAKMIFAEIGFYDNQPTGSVFWIKFPIFECTSEQRYTRHPTLPLETVKKLNVLLVDDNKIINRAFASILQQYHTITPAFSGEEAIEHMANETFDVIICDLYMKKHTSGIDVFGELRKNNSTRPFILVTGDISDVIRKTLIDINKSGDDNLYILLKPVVKKDLLELLARLSNQMFGEL